MRTARVLLAWLSMRRVLALALVLAPVALLAPAATAATPQALPDGATIANVAVGGMSADDAQRALRDALAPVYEKRPVAVRVAHHDTLVMADDAGLVVEYEWMVTRAFALAGAGKPVAVPLHVAIVKAKLAATVAAAGKRVYR